jgi:hypothetical protein
MQISAAIKALSQSEKIKAGLIWVTQIVEMHVDFPEFERAGAEKILKAMIGLIGHEVHIAKKSAPNASWIEVEKDIETALVMINSGVARESGYHLTRALTKVTSIGQKSMSELIDKGLLQI